MSGCLAYPLSYCLFHFRAFLIFSCAPSPSLYIFWHPSQPPSPLTAALIPHSHPHPSQLPSSLTATLTPHNHPHPSQPPSSLNHPHPSHPPSPLTTTLTPHNHPHPSQPPSPLTATLTPHPSQPPSPLTPHSHPHSHPHPSPPFDTIPVALLQSIANLPGATHHTWLHRHCISTDNIVIALVQVTY